MDEFGSLLDAPRARGAFLLRAVLDPPWSIHVQDRAPLTLVAVVRGETWAVPDGDDPLPARAGDVVIARGPEPWTLADHPTTAPQVVIHPGDRCADLDGNPLDSTMSLGVRTWGNARDGATVMLIGTYHLDSEISRRLLDALPPVLVLRAESWGSPLVSLLAGEIVKDEPGQEVVLDRLLDLLLVAALRNWFSGADTAAPSWYRAHRDPVVRHAIRLLQRHPERAWTVADLADEVGVSRAALARRFTETIGEPPMAFLTGWRLALAADLLAVPDATLDAVAGQVGYGSGFALSTAFKRAYGHSPREHRQRLARRDATSAPPTGRRWTAPAPDPAGIR